MSDEFDPGQLSDDEWPDDPETDAWAAESADEILAQLKGDNACWMGYYTLGGPDGHTPIAVPDADLLSWARWFETADRHVADDRIGPWRISTVFLGLDHGWGKYDGMPGAAVLFESMIFAPRLPCPECCGSGLQVGEPPEGAFVPSDGRCWRCFGSGHVADEKDPFEGYQTRYFTWDEAEAGHHKLVVRCRAVVEARERANPKPEAVENERRPGEGG